MLNYNDPDIEPVIVIRPTDPRDVIELEDLRERWATKEMPKGYSGVDFIVSYFANEICVEWMGSDGNKQFVELLSEEFSVIYLCREDVEECITRMLAAPEAKTWAEVFDVDEDFYMDQPKWQYLANRKALESAAKAPSH